MLYFGMMSERMNLPTYTYDSRENLKNSMMNEFVCVF